MFITHLGLSNFRNYTRLELEPPPRMALLQGENAQGKSNLLEAIFLLATTKSPRTSSDKELINWQAGGDSPPVAFISAEVQKASTCLQVEMAFQAQKVKIPGQRRLAEGFPSGGEETPPEVVEETLVVQKRIKVNKILRRAVDLIGQVNVVMFRPEDIDLIGGAPALRRHYLDITNSQLDRRYVRALQRYSRILLQRNHLLRLMPARGIDANELAFWNEQMIETGAFLTVCRHNTVARLEELAKPIHAELTANHELLQLVYWPSVGRGLEHHRDESQQLRRVAEEFKKLLRATEAREIAQGVSLVGPQRDDLRFLVNGVDMGIYGSRGQQRTIALSLRLAEAKLMLTKTGEYPVLLLDEVLSELDAMRRHQLLKAVRDYQQVLITTTDLDRFEPDFLAQAVQFQVRDGKIERIPASAS